MIARAVFSRRVFSRRESTSARFPVWRSSLALLLLSLLSVAAAGAQQTKKWSVGLTFMDLSADNRLESTGTAVRSTPETVAFASAEVEGTDLLGMSVGFRPTRLFGVQLSLTRLGELPASFRTVCDPCELLLLDEGTGEDIIFLSNSHDTTIAADLDVDLYLLDLSFFPPLSRYSTSDGAKLEIFLGPTLVDLSTSLDSVGEDLRGVSADIEVESSLGAHLGLAFHPAPAWTIHATARWIPTELTIDHRARQSPAIPGQGALALNAPLEPAESDWITIGLGFDWRF